MAIGPLLRQAAWFAANLSLYYFLRRLRLGFGLDDNLPPEPLMIENGKDAATVGRISASWRLPADGEPLRFWTMVLLFTLIAVAFQVGAHFSGYSDYIGPDPDDAMRLVEVRDFIQGQGWFDLHQYRLGPAGGTLMHWSRLVDAPIAGLIGLFSLFLSPHDAEIAGVFVWPLLLIPPLLASTALAAYRVGGRQAMVMALLLATLFLCAIIRFRPGGIDHHNVQLVLAIFITAMLLDPRARASNFACAAVAAGLALAIGVETTPLVMVASMMVAGLWAVKGEVYRRAAIGYGSVLAVATATIFVGTTPSSLYGAVTCDTLSVGFFGLAALGGIGLALAASLLSGRSPAVRYAALGAIAVAVAVAARIGMPQCLQNPFATMDPLLQTYWIASIAEAQSVVAEIAAHPEGIGAFYAVGLLGMGVSVFRMLRGQQLIAHAILLALIGVSWAVTLFQIRGMMFANYLAFVPLSALISDLRDIYQAHRKDARAALAFVLAALASIPSVWAFSGVVVLEAGKAIAGVADKDEDEDKDKACVTEPRLKTLAALPAGRILSTTNPGSMLLRFTPHAVLTANYHRNQAGMVMALKIGMAEPAEAWAMIKAAKVGYVLLCKDDPQVGMMKDGHPDGLFARLADGDIPEFLEPVDHGGDSELLIFKVL